MGTLEGRGMPDGIRMSAPAEPAAALQRLAAIAREFSAERLDMEARSLADRVAEGRFYVACVGQFKRGKSTLLNALVGEPILPAAVVPVTSLPTVIRSGPRKTARVRKVDGHWQEIPLQDIEEYVSEEKNPRNAKRIAGVEVFMPSPLLSDGMCFVDTPGLGSVFETNAATTREFIPHIDAALVVVGTDPPLSGDEMELVSAVARHVNDLLFVLNKADRVTEEERAQAIAFARRTLETRLSKPVSRIFEISARDVLERRGPDRDWPDLLEAIEQLAQHSGRTLVRSAGDRGLRRIREQLLAIIREEREALLRPLEESRKRVDTLSRTLTDAERSIGDLSYLLMAEQRRLSESFGDRRKAFLRTVLPTVTNEFRDRVRALPRQFGPSCRRTSMALAQEIARKYLLPWLAQEQTHAEDAFRRAARRFIDIGNDFLRKLADSGVLELADMPDALDADGSLRSKSHFYFNDLVRIAQPSSPLRHLGDLLLGVIRAYGAIQRDAGRLLQELMEVNSTRVQSDVNDRVNDSRQKLESEIRMLLREVRSVAQRAFAHACEAHEQGAAAVEGILDRLAALEQEVRELSAV